MKTSVYYLEMKRSVAMLVLLSMFNIGTIYSQENKSVTERLNATYDYAKYEPEETNSSGIKVPAHYSIEKNNLWGICDIKGQVIVPLKFEWVGCSSSGDFYLTEAANEMYGAYSMSGKEIVPPKYDFIEKDKDYGDVFLVRKKLANGIKYYGILDANGKVIVAPDKYEMIMPIDGTNCYRTFTSSNQKQGLVDKNTGRAILPCIYEHVLYDKINEFFTYATIPDRNDFYGSKNGLLSKDCKPILPCEFLRLDIYHDSSSNRVIKAVKENSDGSLIFMLYDFTGKKITPDYSFIELGGEDMMMCNRGGNFTSLSPESGKGGKWGFINYQGKEIVPVKYDMVSRFKDGVAQVVLDGVSQILTNPLTGTTLQLANGGGGGSKVDANIPETGRTQENTFVFIIANENYSHFKGADYSINDGKVFKEYCKKTMGVPDKNIRYYEDATFGNIVGAMQKIKDIADVYEGDARIILYFSGLGTSDNKKECYLLPTDATLQSLSTTGYSVDKLMNALNALNTEITLVILDAPFSGADKAGVMLADYRGVRIAPKPMTAGGNTIFVTSCSRDETARSDKKYSHSLFTYALLEKLQASKGTCSFKESIDNVTQWVKRESMSLYDATQTPQVVVSENIKNNWQQIKW